MVGARARNTRDKSATGAAPAAAKADSQQRAQDFSEDYLRWRNEKIR